MHDNESLCTVHDPADDTVASGMCRVDSEIAITMAELYAALVAFQTFADHLRGRDVLWFVDKRAAGTCFVKAGSQVAALSLLALRATSLMGALGCRVWAEYIPSPDNIADPLSRDELDDTFVATKLAACVWRFVPAACEGGCIIGALEFDTVWTQFTLA